MGRKIPGRKHRGVKDPEVQKAAREEKLKGKVNAPPSNPHEQELPKSVQNIMRLKEKAKNYKYKPKKKQTNKFLDISMLSRERKLPGMRKPDKVIPSVTQMYGETDETFLNRVDDALDSVISEIQFEKQYGVHVKRNEDTGEIEGLENAAPDEFVQQIRNQKKLKNQERRDKRNKKKEKLGETVPMNSKQRKKMKQLAKKQMECADNNEQLRFHDSVKFGEVVHRPPQLTARPRNAEMKKTGFNKNLLLQKMLTGSEPVTGKNKNMSMMQKLKQEELRKNVVQMYRLSKVREKPTS